MEDIIKQPWAENARRKPVARKPHWNAKLQFLKKSEVNTRRKAINSGLKLDWELLSLKRINSRAKTSAADEVSNDSLRRC